MKEIEKIDYWTLSPRFLDNFNKLIRDELWWALALNPFDVHFVRDTKTWLIEVKIDWCKRGNITPEQFNDIQKSYR